MNTPRQEAAPLLRRTQRGSRQSDPLPSPPCSAIRPSRAFTLVEMLTVIAIIAILAGILLPVIQIVRHKARIATAQSDIKNLEQALTAYNFDFGAFPPDSAASLGPPFPSGLSPNELMVWFLTRTYSTDASTAAGVPGDGLPPWDPPISGTVFARISGGPYFDVKTAQRRDYNENGYYEFVDPWGRPYMYRAYADPWPAAHKIDYIRSAGGLTTYYFRERLGPVGLTGEMTVMGCANASNNGGPFAFSLLENNAAQVSNTGADEDSSPGTAVFQTALPLNNARGCDLYSLGPNGATRAVCRNKSSPADADGWPVDSSGNPREWKPMLSTDFNRWQDLWGSPSAGNDVEGPTGNIVLNAKDRDDINNW